MANSIRLGRGLGALLGDAVNETRQEGITPEDGARVINVDLHLLDPNPFQPRADFDDDAMEELAQSIAIHGVLQPLLVIKGENERYTIVAGERRWRAARRAGLSAVPVIAKAYDDRQLMETALIENLQRTDLNPVEEAEAIQVLMEKYGLTQEVVSSRIGKSRPTIANALRILALPASVVQMVRDGSISSGHARAVLMVQKEDQLAFAQRIKAQGLNVRQAEKLAQAYREPKKPAETDDEPIRDPHLRSAEVQLQRIFGTKVAVSGDLTRGKITIEYFSRDDLERIYEKLLLGE
jgi:ParB family chromosome partitioning protein